MGLFDDHRVNEKLKKIQAAAILSKSGGIARAKALSPAKKSEIASKAAKTRWASNAC